tara:strand:- start:113 stop:244 length:132 start_codon:yes stop_codon:yes gene_type:complete
MPSQRQWTIGNTVCLRNRRINFTVLQRIKPKQKRRRRKGVSTK